jgi:hypothetical protein
VVGPTNGCRFEHQRGLRGEGIVDALLSQEVSHDRRRAQCLQTTAALYGEVENQGFFGPTRNKFWQLELPDKYLVAYPLLANKFNVLNTPEMASELNKQVFSLLVAGAFIPSSPMASSTSTTSTW